MAKVYLNQISKSEELIAGFKKNLSRLSDKGVTTDKLKSMEDDLALLRTYDAENTKLTEELGGKRKIAYRKLTEVKNDFQSMKKIVKLNYDPDKWIQFGVTDKK